jgi:hypothetical protein
MLAKTSLMQGRYYPSVRDKPERRECAYLVFLETVLEYVLHNETASFAQSDFMPHATESFIDVAHDLRWRVAPAKLKQLLPDVASIAMDDSLRDATEQLVDHSRLVLFGNTVESLLDDMATKSIHAQSKSVATYSLSDSDDLIVSTMLEAALHEEIAEAIDHQSISLGDDCLDDLVLLLGCAYLELLLKEDGRLLVVVADDLVYDVLPVAAHVAVQQATIVHRLDRRDVLGSARVAGSLGRCQ